LKDFKFLFEKFLLNQHRPEWQIQKFLGKIHGNIAFDIGAYHGQYAKLFSKRFQHVFAFEPDPEAAKFIEALDRPNIRVYQMALSDVEGEIPLYRYEGLFCPGLMETFDLKMHTAQADGQYKGVNPISVRVGTYDDFASDATVALVKIDVEGAEFKVLEGMRKALLNGKVERIIVELHNTQREQELHSLLSGYGFNLHWLDPSHCYGSLEP
jgi:FkbM family methyltransferase